MRVKPQDKINKTLYKIKSLLDSIINLSDILASGSPEAKEMKAKKPAKKAKKRLKKK